MKLEDESSLYYPLQRGFLVAFASLIIYLIIAVVTTPSLQPLDVIRITFLVNWWVMAGLTIGIGLQTFLVTFSSRVYCNAKSRKMLVGGSGFFSAFSSFLSFFSLIPLGCCGSWLYIISFLPGLIGTSAAGFMIRYSNLLTVIGFLSMGLSIIYTYISIKNNEMTPLRLPRVQ